METNEFKYLDLTGKIIGAAMAVHSEIGNGFQELIYQRALEIEMRANDIQFKREFVMPVYYKMYNIGTRRVDFLIEDKISVEIKAVIQLEPVHMAQALNYLEAFNLEVGLLINFGEKSLRYRRLENKKFKNNTGIFRD